MSSKCRLMIKILERKERGLYPIILVGFTNKIKSKHSERRCWTAPVPLGKSASMPQAYAGSSDGLESHCTFKKDPSGDAKPSWVISKLCSGSSSYCTSRPPPPSLNFSSNMSWYSNPSTGLLWSHVTQAYMETLYAIYWNSQSLIFWNVTGSPIDASHI